MPHRTASYSQAWFMLGQSHAENDQDRLAISCLERAVEMDPYSLDALLVSTNALLIFHWRFFDVFCAIVLVLLAMIMLVTNAIRFLPSLVLFTMLFINSVFGAMRDAFFFDLLFMVFFAMLFNSYDAITSTFLPAYLPRFFCDFFYFVKYDACHHGFHFFGCFSTCSLLLRCFHRDFFIWCFSRWCIFFTMFFLITYYA